MSQIFQEANIGNTQPYQSTIHTVTSNGSITTGANKVLAPVVFINLHSVFVHSVKFVCVYN